MLEFFLSRKAILKAARLKRTFALDLHISKLNFYESNINALKITAAVVHLNNSVK